MPSLPDWTSLGSSPSGNSGRPISTTKDFGGEVSRTMLGNAAAAGDAYKGLQTLGAGLEKVGTGVMAYANEERHRENQLFNAKATADLTAKGIELSAAIDRETDANKISSELAPQYQNEIKRIASTIADDYQREMFLAKSKDDIARFNAGVVTKRLNTIQDNASNADDELKANNLHNAFVKGDDEQRAAAATAMKGLLDARVAAGRMLPGDAKTFMDTWVQKGVLGHFEQMPAEQAVAALGGVRGALMQRESGGRPNLVNQFGFAGLYQFGAPRLKELGVYVPGGGEALNSRDDLRNWNKSGKDAPGKWSGSFNIPGFPEVKNLNDFLRNRAAQEAVMDIHSAKMDQEITKAGLDKYVGTTVSGVPITRDGIKAMMHLGGVGGATAALKGENVSHDANGTSVLEYAKMGIGGDKHLSLLPAEKVKELYDKKVGEFIVGTTQQRLAEQEAERQKKQVTEDVSNDYIGRLLNKDRFDTILTDIHADTRLDNAHKLQLMNIVEREQAQAGKGEAKTLGESYKQAVDDIVNHRITDFEQILKLANDDKLTTQGVHALSGYLSGMKKDTSSAGITTTKARVLDQAKKYLSFEDPNGYIKDPEGERLFNLQFVRQFESEFDKWVQAGKDPYEFLKEENVKPMYEKLRPQDAINRARLSATTEAMNPTQPPANTATNISLPAPAAVKPDLWKKASAAIPNRADGKPDGAYQWTTALTKLVAGRDNPMVRQAFAKRYPGVNADDLLVQLGF